MNNVFQTNDWPYYLRNTRMLESNYKSALKYGHFSNRISNR